MKTQLYVKKIITLISMISLIHAPLYGQMSMNSFSSTQSGNLGPVQSNSSSHWANDIAGIINSVGSQVNGAYNQSMKQQTAMATMQKLQPQFGPAKYFPSCKMPQAVTGQGNLCEGELSASDVQQNQYFTKIANQHVEIFRQMGTKGQNSALPQGVQCLEESFSLLENQLNDQINQMTLLESQVKKENQALRDRLAKIKKNMEKDYSYLYGPQEGDLEQQTQDFSLLYKDSACADVLNSSDTSEKGLVGIRDTMKVSRDDSVKFIQNKGTYQKEVSNMITKLTDNISQYGVESASFTGSQYLIMGNAFNEKKSLFLKEYIQAKKELKSLVGYDLPDLDNNFRSRTASYSVKAQESFKKKLVNDCVSKGDATGVPLTMEQLSNPDFLQTRGNATGTLVTDYLKEVTPIIEADSAVEDKLDALKKLSSDSRYSEVVVNYKIGAQQTALSPYEVFSRAVSKCEYTIAQDNTASLDNPGSQSKAADINDASKYLSNIVNKEKQFSEDVAAEMRDAVMNCNANGSTQAITNQCEPSNMGSTLQITSDQFCFKTAESCAKKTTSCYNKAQTMVQNTVKAMKGYEKNYNSQVEAIIANQELQYKALQAQMTKVSAHFKNYFPKSQFDIPQDGFVVMPEMSEVMGLSLRGGDNIDKTLSSFPDQIAKIKEMMVKQHAAMKKMYLDEIDVQESNISNNLAYWEGVLSKCQNQLFAYNSNINSMNQEMQEKQTEISNQMIDEQYKAQAEADSFCRRYDLAMAAPICDDDTMEVVRDSAEVSAYITPEAAAYLTEIGASCRIKMLEGEDDAVDDLVQRYCDGSTMDFSLVEENLRANAKLVAEQLNTKVDDKEKSFDEDDVNRLIEMCVGSKDSKDSKDECASLRTKYAKTALGQYILLISNKKGTSCSYEPLGDKCTKEDLSDEDKKVCKVMIQNNKNAKVASTYVAKELGEIEKNIKGLKSASPYGENGGVPACSSFSTSNRSGTQQKNSGNGQQNQNWMMNFLQ